MPEPIEAVTFDAAETLFTVVEPVGLSYARLADSHGITADPNDLDEAFRKLYRETPPPHRNGHDSGELQGNEIERLWWKDLVRRIFASLENCPPISKGDFDRLFSDTFDHFGRPDAWKLLPGAIDTLESLRGRVRLGIISNFDRRFYSIAKGLGLSGYFYTVTLSAEAGASKPDPRIFRAAAESLETPPEAIIHAGDDPGKDWQGARNAGFQVYEFHPESAPLERLPVVI